MLVSLGFCYGNLLNIAAAEPSNFMCGKILRLQMHNKHTLEKTKKKVDSMVWK
jgi:hypothetical protein